MIECGENGLGRQYICAVCSGIRVFNVGVVSEVKKTFGRIIAKKANFFFHFKNLGFNFNPQVGTEVFFEVSFLEDGRHHAVNVKPLRRSR
jgi:hypothetical protein